MRKALLKKRILINIEKDRDKSMELVQHITEYLQANLAGLNGEEYSKIMLSAAKLMEASQKSNEQIVKVLEIASKQKKITNNSNSLSSEEIEQLMTQEVVEIEEK